MRTLLLIVLLAPAAVAGPRSLDAALAADGRFSTLRAALLRAGFGELLAGDGPFTVFAPTDAAFAKLPADALEDRRRLVATLAYHVVDGRLGKEGSGKTLQGARLKLSDVPVDGEAVACANGVLYAIDRVLTPPPPPPAGTEFEPIMEAPLPAGWPAPGPVGAIVLQTYPKYRVARTESGMFAFGTLFRHIKQREIAMTAPVEMGLAESETGVRTKDMGFLYRRVDQGPAGKDGSVEITDVAPMRALSLGVRGPMSPAKMNEGVARLRKELAARADLAAAGSPRLLGYNSPMIPARNRFYELQLPVKDASESPR